MGRVEVMAVGNEDGDVEEVYQDKKCKIRPVHVFLGLACAMTLCGFVLTVYGGVKIYYHDVFKGMKIQSKEIYAKDLAQMYKMFKRIAFFKRKHPEFIDCGRMQETQLKHMDTFDLKRSYIRANYDSCVEKKMNVIFFPIVAAIWGVIAVLSSALLAVSMSMLMVAIQLVTHNTMDVRVKWS